MKRLIAITCIIFMTVCLCACTKKTEDKNLLNFEVYYKSATASYFDGSANSQILVSDINAGKMEQKSYNSIIFDNDIEWTPDLYIYTLSFDIELNNDCDFELLFEITGLIEANNESFLKKELIVEAKQNVLTTVSIEVNRKLDSGVSKIKLTSNQSDQLYKNGNLTGLNWKIVGIKLNAKHII